MEKQIMTAADVSSVAWEGLESWLRGEIQTRLQEVLEEEVTALLGRMPHERKTGVDAEPGYRNGYGKPRKLTLSCGAVEVRRPRVRGLEERFESRILRAFKRRSQALDETLPELYLHGLSQGDFDLALRGLLGEDAPISATSIARLKAKWQGEYEAWKETSLADLEVTYLWVDGIYVKAGLEKEKAALLVVLAGLSNGDKVFLAVEPGYRESSELGQRASKSSATRHDLPKGGVRRRTLGHLGRLARDLPRGGGTALLEPPNRERTEARTQEAAGGGFGEVEGDSLRGHASRGRGAEGEVSAMGEAAGVREGGKLAGRRLGADGGLLRFPQGTLAASADDEPGGVAVLDGEAAHTGSTALQEGAERHGDDLEDPAGSRAELPQVERAGAHERCFLKSRI